jgi:hypothetical protein
MWTVLAGGQDASGMAELIEDAVAAGLQFQARAAPALSGQPTRCGWVEVSLNAPHAG